MRRISLKFKTTTVQETLLREQDKAQTTGKYLQNTYLEKD